MGWAWCARQKRRGHTYIIHTSCIFSFLHVRAAVRKTKRAPPHRRRCCTMNNTSFAITALLVRACRPACDSQSHKCDKTCAPNPAQPGPRTAAGKVVGPSSMPDGSCTRSHSCPPCDAGRETTFPRVSRANTQPLRRCTILRVTCTNLCNVLRQLSI